MYICIQGGLKRGGKGGNVPPWDITPAFPLRLCSPLRLNAQEGGQKIKCAFAQKCLQSGADKGGGATGAVPPPGPVRGPGILASKKSKEELCSIILFILS